MRDQCYVLSSGHEGLRRLPHGILVVLVNCIRGASATASRKLSDVDIHNLLLVVLSAEGLNVLTCCHALRANTIESNEMVELCIVIAYRGAVGIKSTRIPMILIPNVFACK